MSQSKTREVYMDRRQCDLESGHPRQAFRHQQQVYELEMEPVSWFSNPTRRQAIAFQLSKRR
jgi:hypothetical protein